VRGQALISAAARTVRPPGGYRQSGGGFTVTGSGDIDPVADPGAGSVAQTLVGMFAGLIGVITVAAIFITAEYRRGGAPGPGGERPS
jgi:hypothetical protein